MRRFKGRKVMIEMWKFIYKNKRPAPLCQLAIAFCPTALESSQQWWCTKCVTYGYMSMLLCISYSSTAVKKYHSQSSLEKKGFIWDYSSREIGTHPGRGTVQQAAGMAVGTGSWGLPSWATSWKLRDKLGVGWDVKLLASRDIPPSAGTKPPQCP